MTADFRNLRLTPYNGEKVGLLKTRAEAIGERVREILPRAADTGVEADRT